MDYQIQPHTRCCAVTGKEIKPGDKFYTVLVDEDHHFVRKDYCSEAWQGPPPNAFSFWMGRMPDDSAPRRLLIDDEILMDCFGRLEGQNDPNKVNFRYVVALLLMRRKRLKFEDALHEDGQEVLVLRAGREKKTYKVVNPRLSDDEIETVQNEVFKVLGWD